MCLGRKEQPPYNYNTPAAPTPRITRVPTLGPPPPSPGASSIQPAYADDSLSSTATDADALAAKRRGRNSLRIPLI